MICSSFRALGRKEQGSFTLEASLVMPMLGVLIISFVVYGLYMHQQMIAYYAAASAAEQSAYSWDNSHRELTTGILTEPDYDSLYWRIGQDSMLRSLFGLRADEGETVLKLAGSGVEYSEGHSSNLITRKLTGSAQRLKNAAVIYEGELAYRRSMLRRTIAVKLKQPMAALTLPWARSARYPSAMAEAAVVEPTEFIRSVDLVRYYSGKLTGGRGGSASESSDAAKVLESYGDGL